MKTAIITDTNSGLTVEDGKRIGVYVLPMPVIVDGRGYLEGVDITHSELYEALRSDRDVCTSQPSPGDVTELWESVFREGYDEIVYIPMTSGLSSSCESAAQYAQDYDSRVYVVDNHRISATLAESVYNAKTLADGGYSAIKIKEILENSALHASIYITVNSLKYLKKSGRITSSAAAIANLLNIKPVLTIQGEKLDSYAKVRGWKAAKKTMLDAAQKDLEGRFKGKEVYIQAAYTCSDEEALAWKAEIEERFPGHDIHMDRLSLSVSCHIGAGSRAVACIKKTEY